MPLILLTPPAVEPLSLAEAKHFLRVDHDDDDDLIAALVTGARGHVEAATRRALVTQAWRITLDAWPPGGCIRVLMAPLQSVSAVRLRDSAGDASELDAAAFSVVAGSAPGLIETPAGLPAPLRRHGGIEIDVIAGHGDAATDVPEPLRQAVRMLLAHWYENRGLVPAAGSAPSPAAVTAALAPLLAPYRVVTL